MDNETSIHVKYRVYRDDQPAEIETTRWTVRTERVEPEEDWRPEVVWATTIYHEDERVRRYISHTEEHGDRTHEYFVRTIVEESTHLRFPNPFLWHELDFDTVKWPGGHEEE